MAIDGTCLDVADTVDNDGWFGRPGVNKGERAAFPQARLVGLAECATHAVVDAEVGSYTTAENTLAGPLIDRLSAGMVVFADRGFCGVPVVVKGRGDGRGPVVAGDAEHEARADRHAR